MTNELEPCPFCGKSVSLENEEDFYRASCPDDDCPARNDNWFETEKEAVEAWNTRYKRTCNMAAPNRETMPYPRCSACGAPMLNAPNRYCAQCGAEVVDGD